MSSSLEGLQDKIGRCYFGTTTNNLFQAINELNQKDGLEEKLNDKNRNCVIEGQEHNKLYKSLYSNFVDGEEGYGRYEPQHGIFNPADLNKDGKIDGQDAVVLYYQKLQKQTSKDNRPKDTWLETEIKRRPDFKDQKAFLDSVAQNLKPQPQLLALFISNVLRVITGKDGETIFELNDSNPNTELFKYIIFYLAGLTQNYVGIHPIIIAVRKQTPRLADADAINIYLALINRSKNLRDCFAITRVIAGLTEADAIYLISRVAIQVDSKWRTSLVLSLLTAVEQFDPEVKKRFIDPSTEPSLIETFKQLIEENYIHNNPQALATILAKAKAPKALAIVKEYLNDSRADYRAAAAQILIQSYTYKTPAERAILEAHLYLRPDRPQDWQKVIPLRSAAIPALEMAVQDTTDSTWSVFLRKFAAKRLLELKAYDNELEKNVLIAYRDLPVLVEDGPVQKLAWGNMVKLGPEAIPALATGVEDYLTEARLQTIAKINSPLALLHLLPVLGWIKDEALKSKTKAVLAVFKKPTTLPMLIRAITWLDKANRADPFREYLLELVESLKRQGSPYIKELAGYDFTTIIARSKDTGGDGPAFHSPCAITIRPQKNHNPRSLQGLFITAEFLYDADTSYKPATTKFSVNGKTVFQDTFTETRKTKKIFLPCSKLPARLKIEVWQGDHFAAVGIKSLELVYAPMQEFPLVIR